MKQFRTRAKYVRIRSPISGDVFELLCHIVRSAESHTLLF